MPDIEEESLRCIGLLYDAVLDKKEWPGILEAIATALLGNSAMLRHINPQTREIAFYETIGYETHFVRAYHEYFSLLDPYQAILQKAPVGQLLNPDHDLGHGRRRASEYFNDFDLPQDKIHVIGGVLHRDAT